MSDNAKFVPRNANVKFRAEQEPWTIYELENGAMVRVRPVLIFVKETGEAYPKGHPQAGIPVMQFRFEQLMHVDFAPEQQAEINKRRREMGEEVIDFDLTWGNIQT